MAQELRERHIIRAPGATVAALRVLLSELETPFVAGQKVGIKLHWGERGNQNFLPPALAGEIVRWLQARDISPFIFDTTVLYSGGRRTGKDSLATAAAHGYREEELGCPVIIGDGMDGHKVINIAAGFQHFDTVQVASLVPETDGFVLFSHFKGHQAMGFGGALKNLSMGFASRAQKQRMHADVCPELDPGRCNRCGDCLAHCPVGAARFAEDGYPIYDRTLCIGCAQCIAMCPRMALKILWGKELKVFQEKLVETAAALWRLIGRKTVCINALIGIASECDCMTGRHPVIAPDYGFIGGTHPLAVDEESLAVIGAGPFEEAHPDVPWRRQFDYAEEIRFYPGRGCLEEGGLSR